MIKRTIMAIVVMATLYLQPNQVFASDDGYQSSEVISNINAYCPFVTHLSRDVMTLRQYGFSKDEITNFATKVSKGDQRQDKLELVKEFINNAYTEPVEKNDDDKKAAINRFVAIEKSRCIKAAYDMTKDN